MNGDSLLGRRVLVEDARSAAVEARWADGMPALLEQRADWNRLVLGLRDPRFFHEHAWHASYLAHLEADTDRVHVVSLLRDGRVVALFPLRRVRRTVAGIELNVWELPHAPHVDLCDILVARSEDSAALMCEMVRALSRRCEFPWDALHLPRMLDDSVALRAIQAAPLSFVQLARSGRSMYFRCDSLADALRDVTPQFSRNLRRQRRKLDRHGRTEVALVREPGELPAAFDDFLRVEASGWKGTCGCGSAIALHREVEGFYRELALRFGAERRCAINLLRLDGRPIAAQFGLLDNRRLNLLKIAYDEAYAAEAPGSRLLHDVLTHCCDAGDIDELSLVTGPSWASGRWNPQAHDVWSAWVFNASPRGLAAYTALRLKPVAAAARKALAGGR